MHTADGGIGPLRFLPPLDGALVRFYWLQQQTLEASVCGFAYAVTGRVCACFALTGMPWANEAAALPGAIGVCGCAARGIGGS